MGHGFKDGDKNGLLAVLIGTDCHTSRGRPLGS